jgi:hypothetical protein
MMSSVKPRRVGRPHKAEGKPRAKIRSFRLRPELDARLIAEAQKANRTVSDEIELRLEQSFEVDARVRAVAQAAVSGMLYRMSGHGDSSVNLDDLLPPRDVNTLYDIAAPNPALKHLPSKPRGKK